MTRSLLVLGGTGFVGRALVDEGLARGFSVTTFNRGHAPGPSDARVQRLIGDRLDPASLTQLTSRDWDLVTDTWAGAPCAARDSAAALAGRAARYVYISSCSVYAPPPPIGLDESAPTVAASPDAQHGDYSELKRGAELAILQGFGHRALLARPGLILGPQENVGRLLWWLGRMARGGDVLAPGPPDLPLQFVDARDLARFVLDASAQDLGGPFNVVSRRGHATMGSLLEACLRVAGSADARLTWLAPETVLQAGIEPWTELPVWIPPEHEYAGMHAANVERAHAAGLRCRPVEDTVTDTWEWLSGLGAPPPLRPGLPAPGLDPDRERAALAG